MFPQGLVAEPPGATGLGFPRFRHIARRHDRAVGGMVGRSAPTAAWSVRLRARRAPVAGGSREPWGGLVLSRE